MGAMRRVVGAAVVVFGMLALSGCGTGDPLPTLPPTPSTAPVFASEEEALAAAEAAYGAYLDVWNMVAREGGVNPERIRPVSAGAFYDSELEGLKTFSDNGWRSEGDSAVAAAILQYADLETGSREAVVAAYVCLDVSGLDVVDADGASVVSPNRPSLQAFEVTFDLTVDDSLVPSDSVPWEPESICGSN